MSFFNEGDNEFLKKVYVSGRLNKSIIEFQENVDKISCKVPEMSNKQLGSLAGAFEQFGLVLKDLIEEDN